MAVAEDEGRLINYPPQDWLIDLLARSAQGDRDAFADLYRQSAPHLYALALRLLRSADAAQEVLQDSFASIWLHAPDYATTRGAPMNWMASIVRHRALDVLRQPVSRLRLVTDADVEMPAEPDLEPLEQAIAADHSAALLDCMRRLSGPQRQTIMLAFFHGLTHSEVAGHLAKPLGTVKTWIRQALVSLKGCIDS
ncbi:MAG TPA: sigma-70 family RNA polymerase sigma factor [Burkholderiales bacterium]|nr:sigma-70 family RNA polymerase sigma factor [Burkholderiales bacterium]